MSVKSVSWDQIAGRVSNDESFGTQTKPRWRPAFTEERDEREAPCVRLGKDRLKDQSGQRVRKVWRVL